MAAPNDKSTQLTTAELAAMRLGRFDSTTAAHQAIAEGQARVDEAHVRVDEARQNGWDWDTYADASRAEGAARLDLFNIQSHAAEQYGHGWQMPPSSMGGPAAAR